MTAMRLRERSQLAPLATRSRCALALAARAGDQRLRHDASAADHRERARRSRRRSPTSASTGPAAASLGHPLAAADGLKGYINTVGDSVYYGDCVHSKGILGGGSCLLPLQVTTVIYELHSNATLGAQRNIVVRGVPATVYDDGRSIEIYSGRVAIDVFSDTLRARARRRAGAAAAERARLGARRAAAAGLLPGPLRRAERRRAARDGTPSRPRLPARRRRARVRQERLIPS